MNTVALIVQSTTLDLTPADARLPSLIWKPFCVFHWMHRTWRWYRFGKLYSNPNNFIKLSTGHVLNYYFGENIYLKMAAQCVYITSLILDCVEQQKKLYHTYQKWLDAVQGNYPNPVAKRWIILSDSTMLSPSSFQKWSDHFDNGTRYIKNVSQRTGSLFKQCFKLSMLTADAVEAFSMSPSSSNQGVNEMFVHGPKCLEAIADNKEELIKKLKENKTIINKVLTGIQGVYNADQFISVVEKAAERAQSASETIKKVNQVATDILLETLKQGIFGFMSSIGMSKFLPDSLLPTQNPIPEKENPIPNKVYARFAPVCWITRLKELEELEKLGKMKKAPHPNWEVKIEEGKPNRYVQKNYDINAQFPIAQPPLPVVFKVRTIDDCLAEAAEDIKRSN